MSSANGDVVCTERPDPPGELAVQTDELAALDNDVPGVLQTEPLHSRLAKDVFQTHDAIPAEESSIAHIGYLLPDSITLDENGARRPCIDPIEVHPTDDHEPEHQNGDEEH
jgi:hypothetical protein